MASKKRLFDGVDWDTNTLKNIYAECQTIAVEEMGLDVYPNQLEIVSSEHMVTAYTSVGMPINYNHWSFGKHFLQQDRSYKSGESGLAYELVINANPCINYLMENNTATVQAVVIAHAAFGHNHFFKNNYLYKMWTDASSIIDYLDFAKNYISKCEENYGYDAVEQILDSCHALKYQGIDRYKHPKKINFAEESRRQAEREEYLQKNVSYLWQSPEKTKKEKESKFPAEPQENILKFIEKNSPILAPWQREIIRIVRKITQYFYPQMQTQVMNEGFASFTHDYIMNRLYDKDLIGDGTMLEYIKTNAGVLNQLAYGNFNPYALGLSMYRDIRRACENPTKQDREWFPDICGKNYMEVIREIVENYRDDSFVLQFLGPNVIEKFKMFRIEDHDADYYEVSNIHDDRGYKDIRRALSRRYEVNNLIPNIQIVNANLNSDRTLELHHYIINGCLLEDEEATQCLAHIKRLWGFTPWLVSYNSAGKEIKQYKIV
jgi:stage V sporulation protein R